ncbi:methylmalonyl-CoA mutase family protein [Streptomyces sp. C10-9-1]|uniref:methylmalonyl-CoA mutase family protein n=1 Tax=Streptomyces sp. C10-9-1 TaxID=1859285 RepID=UPI003D754C00
MDPVAQSKSGLPIQPVYDGRALADFDSDARLGTPGRFRFICGVHPTMHTGRPWTMRKYAAVGTAKESDERYPELVAAGTGGPTPTFDLPTPEGDDSDTTTTHSEAGEVGVAIDSIKDMRTLFQGLPPDRTTRGSRSRRSRGRLAGSPRRSTTRSARWWRSTGPSSVRRIPASRWAWDPRIELDQ